MTNRRFTSFGRIETLQTGIVADADQKVVEEEHRCWGIIILNYVFSNGSFFHWKRLAISLSYKQSFQSKRN